MLYCYFLVPLIMGGDMTVNKRNSDWILSYVIVPILLVLLIGASTKIHFMSKSKIDRQDKKLTKMDNTFTRILNR